MWCWESPQHDVSGQHIASKVPLMSEHPGQRILFELTINAVPVTHQGPGHKPPLMPIEDLQVVQQLLAREITSLEAKTFDEFLENEFGAVPDNARRGLVLANGLQQCGP